MKSNISQLKETMLDTSYPSWRRLLSTLLLIVTCITVVMCFVYLYVNDTRLYCYQGFLIFSFIWLFVELVAIAYLYLWKNIPRFARDAIVMNIAFSNIWFGLFIFSVNACAE